MWLIEQKKLTFSCLEETLAWPLYQDFGLSDLHWIFSSSWFSSLTSLTGTNTISCFHKFWTFSASMIGWPSLYAIWRFWFFLLIYALFLVLFLWRLLINTSVNSRRAFKSREGKNMTSKGQFSLFLNFKFENLPVRSNSCMTSRTHGTFTVIYWKCAE